MHLLINNKTCFYYYYIIIIIASTKTRTLVTIKATATNLCQL